MSPQKYWFCALLLLALPVVHAADAPPATAPVAKAPEEKAVVFSNPRGLAVDKDGYIYVGDASDGAIYKINAQGKGARLEDKTAKPGANGTLSSEADIASPMGVAVDKDGNVYVADADSDTIRKYSKEGKWTILAGKNGQAGEADGKGDVARFNGATCLAVDSKGNIIVGDTHNAVVRKITPDGTVTTLAGKASATDAKNIDGKASDARFGSPRGIAIDSADNIYVADESFGVVRKITPEGMVTTLAGNSTSSGTSKDGTGAEAVLGSPRGITVDAKGMVYLADTDSATIRKITPAGVVTTLAGKNNEPGSADGKGGDARFSGPRGLAVDKDGNVYVADSDNAAVRKITPEGVVTTVGKADAKTTTP